MRRSGIMSSFALISQTNSIRAKGKLPSVNTTMFQMLSIGRDLIETWFTRAYLENAAADLDAARCKNMNPICSELCLPLRASRTRGKVLKLGPDSTVCSDEYRQKL